MTRGLKWAMLGPALAFIGLMIVFPLVFTVNLSFTNAFGAVFDYQEYDLAAAVLVLFTLVIVGVVMILRRGGRRETT
ncbi:sugar ABC transporter permease [Kibdelosporangium aridum]|uniref:sugar ABC transporter permease n=1 Tax=Kibdelosporangium aridum TaxID=2030 RepID=UPI00056A6287|nr:sugar ABC transporter permease [Kibdelosporangium aridum]